MEIKELLKDVAFFSSLNEEELAIIESNGKIKNIQKGQFVHSPEEICRNITVVIEGNLHSSNYSLNGNEQIVCNFKPKGVFGYPVVFGDLTYPEHIIAETDCKLLYISRETLLQLFDNKTFLLSFIETLSKKIKSFSNLVEILSYTSVKERIGKYLLKQSLKQKTNVIVLGKPKAKLAKELGTSRVVVSRTFKTLEDEKIIQRIDEQNIKILDIDALEYFS